MPCRGGPGRGGAASAPAARRDAAERGRGRRRRRRRRPWRWAAGGGRCSGRCWRPCARPAAEPVSLRGRRRAGGEEGAQSGAPGLGASRTARGWQGCSGAGGGLGGPARGVRPGHFTCKCCFVSPGHRPGCCVATPVPPARLSCSLGLQTKAKLKSLGGSSAVISLGVSEGSTSLPAPESASFAVLGRSSASALPLSHFVDVMCLCLLGTLRQAGTKSCHRSAGLRFIPFAVSQLRTGVGKSHRETPWFVAQGCALRCCQSAGFSAPRAWLPAKRNAKR